MADQPPPYTPRDPNAPPSPPSPPARTSPAGTPPPPPPDDLPTLRGGFIRRGPRGPMDDVGSVTSQGTFFEDRMFTNPVKPPLLVLENEIHPSITREELSLPLSDAQCEERQVTYQDWATFVNFLLAQLSRRQWATDGAKSHDSDGMSAEEFYQCKTQMVRTVDEWNRCYFMPRGIHFNVLYAFSSRNIAGPSLPFNTVAPLPEDFHPNPPAYASPSQPIAQPAGPAPPGWSAPAAGAATSGLGNLNRASDSLPSLLRRFSVSSSSSSSSVSSASSISSLSSGCLSDADLDKVRLSLADFRMDASRSSHMKTAVEGLTRDLKDCRLSQQERASRRQSNNDPKAKAEYKSLKGAARHDLTQLNHEIRQHNQQERRRVQVAKQTKAEQRRLRKQERDAAKRERRAQRQADRQNRRDSREDQLRSPVLQPSSPTLSTCPFTGPGSETSASTSSSLPSIVNTMQAPTVIHFSGPPVDINSLSKADRKLETQARRIDRQANHWARVVAHWQGHMTRWAGMVDQQNQTLREAYTRRDAQLAEQIARMPAGPRQDRLILRRRLEAERAQNDQAKRAAHAEKPRAKWQKGVNKMIAKMERNAEQARQTRAKMAWQPPADWQYETVRLPEAGQDTGVVETSQASSYAESEPPEYQEPHDYDDDHRSPGESSSRGLQRSGTSDSWMGRMAPGGRSWSESFSQSMQDHGHAMEQWAAEHGRTMGQWGANFGQRMNEQGEEHGRQMALLGESIGRYMEAQAASIERMTKR